MSNISGYGATRIQQFVRTNEDYKTTNLNLDTGFKATGNVMSGAELMKLMGGKPKYDLISIGPFSFGSRSTEYKTVVVELAKFQSTLESLANTPASNSDNARTELKSRMYDVQRAAQAYVTKHTGDPEKQNRIGVMSQLIETLNHEIDTLDETVRQSVDRFGEDVTLKAAIVLPGSGVTNPSQISTKHTDSTLVGEPKVLGSGMMNTVLIAEFKVGENVEQRVLKPLKGSVGSFVAKEGVIGLEKNDVRWAARNIGSGIVADRMGMTKLLPQSDVVIHQGQAYLSMEMGPGESLFGTSTVKADDITANNFDDMERRGRGYDIPHMGGVRNEAGEWCKNTEGARKIPLLETKGDPKIAYSIQKQMLDLQLLDAICGQVDRNRGNFLIQVKKDGAQVTAIDNDLSFGKNMTGINGLDQKDLRNDTRYYLGPPPLMTKDGYEMLMSLDKNELGDALSEAGLSESEISACWSRIDKLRDHAAILKITDRVVDEFESWTYEDKSSGKTYGTGEYLAYVVKDNYINSFQGQIDTYAQRKAPEIDLSRSKHDIN